MKRLWNKRLRQFEPYDRITMEIVPRYKTSGLSGDEWRQNIWIRFWFKGEAVHEFTSSTMENAASRLSGELLNASLPIADQILKLEPVKCDQPGCENAPVARFKLKKIYCSEGKPHDEEWSTSYRKFCEKHLRRGDCGLEDADSNYEPLDEKSAKDSTNTEESPSAFGGVIVLGKEPGAE